MLNEAPTVQYMYRPEGVNIWICTIYHINGEHYIFWIIQASSTLALYLPFRLSRNESKPTPHLVVSELQILIGPSGSFNLFSGSTPTWQGFDEYDNTLA